MPKKVKVETVAFACSICKRKYGNKFHASECEKGCKIKKISKNICKEATSIDHYEELLSKAFPSITISFSNLKLCEAHCYSRTSVEPAFKGTVKFESSKKDGLYKFNKEYIVGLRLGSGGGSHEKQIQECYIFINDLPKVLKKFKERNILLIEEAKESVLYNSREDDRYNWNSKEINNHKELKKLKIERESIFEKIKEIEKREYAIRHEVREKSYEKFPDLPTPIAYKVESLINEMLCGAEIPEEDYDGLLY